jgi:(4-(4-[2-(gamma-L-glutamylamino)ethyl]phenoxymethyl)furan-2-yl)methanamine synthase
MGDDTLVVGAGCGAFLLPDLCAAAGLAPQVPLFDYGSDVVRTAASAAGGQAALRAWVRVCAPSVAVAALFDEANA